MNELRNYRFPADLLETKPGPQGKRLTFVDVRNIASVLDELKPGWSSTMQLMHTGQEYAAVCTIALDSTSRADTGCGKTPMDASNQAFRRCAATHGLGAYLWTDEQERNSPLLDELNRIGETLYGKRWPQVCRRNVERISQGAITTAAQLHDDQIQRLIIGLQKLQHPKAA